MSAATDGGVQYSVWANDGSTFTCAAEDEPLIDRAMKLWAESRRDTWVSVHGPSGAEHSLLASTITSTMRTDAAIRLASTHMDKSLADERAENRRIAGFIESEP
jgi:hypothetical protein